MTDPRVKAARDLIRRGWEVVPLRGKRPFTANWPDNPLALDELGDNGWNFGILLTDKQRLICCDFDCKNGAPGLATLADWKELFSDFDRDPDQITPSGGLHYVLRVPDEVDMRTLPNGGAAPGVDLLRDRRQFVVAPSYIEQGEYRGTLPETPGDVPLISRAFLEHLQSLVTRAPTERAEPDRAPSVEAVRNAVSRIPNTATTDRDEWVRMAFSIKGAVGSENEAEGLEIFQEWAARWEGNDSGENERVYETAQPKAGWLALQKSAGLLLEEAQRAFGVVEAESESKPEVDSPDYVWLEELAANPDALKPPTAIIPRLAWPKRTTLLTGAPKSGKSTLLSDGVARLTRGEDFLGTTCEPAVVLWYCLDEPVEDLARRLLSYGADPNMVAISTKRHAPKDIEAVIGRVMKARNTSRVVCVIDSLARYATGTVTSPGDAHQWTSLLNPLTDAARRTGCAMVWVHHNKKGTGEARDSTAIEAEADIILSFQPHAKGETRREVFMRGRLTPEDLLLDWKDARYVLCTDRKNGNGSTVLGWKVLEALNQAVEPLTTNAWMLAAADRAKVGRTQYYDARKELMDAGYVTYDLKRKQYSITPEGQAALQAHYREEMGLLPVTEETE